MCVGSKAGSVWALFATHGKPLITSHQCVTAECQIHLLLTDQVCGNGSGILTCYSLPFFVFSTFYPFARWTCVLKFAEVCNEVRGGGKKNGLKIGLLMVSSWLSEVYGLSIFWLKYIGLYDCVHFWVWSTHVVFDLCRSSMIFWCFCLLIFT